MPLACTLTFGAGGHGCTVLPVSRTPVLYIDLWGLSA